MKKVTVENYRNDKYYPKIVRAVEAILAKGDVVSPIEVFVHMELLGKARRERRTARRERRTAQPGTSFGDVVLAAADPNRPVEIKDPCHEKRHSCVGDEESRP